MNDVPYCGRLFQIPVIVHSVLLQKYVIISCYIRGPYSSIMTTAKDNRASAQLFLLQPLLSLLTFAENNLKEVEFKFMTIYSTEPLLFTFFCLFCLFIN